MVNANTRLHIRDFAVLELYTAAVNWLSAGRANATRSYLVNRGANGSRIFTAGRGSREPIATNATAAGRAQNRRVEIYLGEVAN